MNATLDTWNAANAEDAIETMIACCGSRRWAEAMVARRPLPNVKALVAAADSIWSTMEEADWMEAFACHPRIGERKSAHASVQSADWSQQEQCTVAVAPGSTLAALARGNGLYEERFGFTYIVCATGKSADELLDLLHRRLARERSTELLEAAEQQRQITQIRLRKWLAV
jgi:OHCU decarboxylase